MQENDYGEYHCGGGREQQKKKIRLWWHTDRFILKKEPTSFVYELKCF
jgi:hypothetical protein